MHFTYVTLFEGLITSYFEDSILKRAIAKELLHVDFANPRDFTNNKHGKVDDYQASGGAGTQPSKRSLPRFRGRNTG